MNMRYWLLLAAVGVIWATAGCVQAPERVDVSIGSRPLSSPPVMIPFTFHRSLGSIARPAIRLFILPLVKRNSAFGRESKEIITELSEDRLNLSPTVTRTIDNPKK